MQEKRQEAVQYMLTHPTREGHLIGNRFISIWSGGTPNPMTDFLGTPSPWFRFILAFNLLVAVGALFGVVILFRSQNVVWFPVAVFPIVYPWAYYLTLALPRYRLPIDPVVLLLTAVALRQMIYGRKQAVAQSTAPKRRQRV
jgi:hypothetical protein